MRLSIAIASSIFIAPAGAAEPPPNLPAAMDWSPAEGRLRLLYRDEAVLDGTVFLVDAAGERRAGDGDVEVSRSVAGGEAVEGRIRIAPAAARTGLEVVLRGTVTASGEAFPAETLSGSKAPMPFIRNSAGLSRNRRNHAVYDRKWDWTLEGPAGGRTRIEPRRDGTDRIRFAWESRGPEVELAFRPRLYGRHKGLRYFEPWLRPVRRDSITGWCSWWAYRADFSEKDLRELLDVFAGKRLGDFGYRFIQIDDAYQGGSGTPRSWLEWNQKFPSGMKGYAEAVRAKGFDPAVWIGAFFRDEAVVREHPEWFVRDPGGKPFKGPWIDYGLDASSAGAAEALVRPVYRGFREAGFAYVKIDTLRHLLYDSIHRAPGYGKDRGLSGDDVFRSYLAAAREELGPETFVLACWGVLPEALGFADGCRLGGDGFGPCTLQQYSSWGGVVWRNDPDHCDVIPGERSAGTAVVRIGGRTLECPRESLLRPALASLGGAMLMLSDRPDAYRRDENLEGARRSSPVLFTVPGQLADFDPRKSDGVVRLDRAAVVSGGPPSPIDADQTGEICPWWLLEVERPFESWSVLARMNWTGRRMEAAAVRFADLGLPDDRELLVHEFWSGRFAGAIRGSFEAAPVEPMGIACYAIRESLGRPQVLSTSRHLSAGGVDLEEAAWEAGGKPAAVSTDGPIARIHFTPAATGPVEWSARFDRD